MATFHQLVNEQSSPLGLSQHLALWARSRLAVTRQSAWYECGLTIGHGPQETSALNIFAAVRPLEAGFCCKRKL